MSAAHLTMVSRLPGLAALAALLGCAEPPAAAPPPAAPLAAPAAPAGPAPAAEPEPPATVHLGGGCEEAKTAYVKECQNDPTICADTSAPAGTVSYGSVLNHGTYLNACGLPPSTAVKICAAIRGGRAIAVTVTTTPGHKGISGCIGRAVQAMDFPSSPRLDVASTVFAAQ